MGQSTYKITINGTVQGVGFRPFIYKLAKELNLNGYILNNQNGVEIVINSTKETLEEFLNLINKNLPPLAKIVNLSVKQIEPKEFSSFTIKSSTQSGKITADIPPDLSICKECEAELFNPNNRRYLYPFITCTNCGVRYSIIKSLPYDRENTSMAKFTMCKECSKEYNNPLDRRYHAEPIACWSCGPTLDLQDLQGSLGLNQNEIVTQAVKLIKSGKILAIKGVGGYHLVCDALNKEAVDTLRSRKNRPTKPFAIMVKDITMAKELAYINKKEEELLLSKERPIVLLKSKNSLPSSIAPNISKIGIFLPYTPLHLLIMNALNSPIVATSANLSDEPIATNYKEISKLKGIYDYLLEHSRDIVNGCDDSVVTIINNQKITIRRARGYSPYRVSLPFKLKDNILALGANQKNSIAIALEDKAILSPHIGDLDGVSSIEYFKKTIENLKRIYKFTPNVVVCDLHPNYESTKYAKSLNLPTRAIQHHYAHILSVMVEHNLKDSLGVAFDGTGLGDDNNLWGGEFLKASFNGYKRVAHFKYFKLLGGALAIKEPRRVALSLLFDIFNRDAFNLDNPTINSFRKEELKSLYLMWQKGLNAPLSSSVGRLFDGVASLVGICQKISFEGESGMRLEEFYNPNIKKSFSFSIKNGVINIDSMIKEILEQKDKEFAISCFFNTLVEIIATIYKDYSNTPLVLSGGVFQNRVLVELILNRLKAIIPNEIPINDGGISLGQIASMKQW